MEAEGAEGEPRDDADQRAGEHLDDQKRRDLPIDFGQNLQCDLLFAQRRSRYLDQLFAIEVARREQKEREKQNQHELPERGRQA